jgi:Glycosyltransferase Family 4
MRVLLTADPELPVPPKLYGGIERIVDLLLVGLQARGHAVGLVAHQESTSPACQFFPWPGVQSFNKLDVIENTHALWSAVKTFQPDIIHSFSRVFYLLPLLRSSLQKVMSYQRFPTSRTIKWSSRLAGNTLTFTGCSDYICQQGRLSGGVWHPIYNCVDIEKYTYQEVASKELKVLTLPLQRLKELIVAYLLLEIKFLRKKANGTGMRKYYRIWAKTVLSILVL